MCSLPVCEHGPVPVSRLQGLLSGSHQKTPRLGMGCRAALAAQWCEHVLLMGGNEIGALFPPRLALDRIHGKSIHLCP